MITEKNPRILQISNQNKITKQIEPIPNYNMVPETYSPKVFSVQETFVYRKCRKVRLKEISSKECSTKTPTSQSCSKEEEEVGEKVNVDFSILSLSIESYKRAFEISSDPSFSSWSLSMKTCLSNHHHYHYHHYSKQISIKLLFYFFFVIPWLFSSSFSNFHLKTSSSTSSDFSSTNFFQFFCFAQSASNFPFSNRRAPTTSTTEHYIEYNLADYCTEENWSDYPGRHRIRLEKSVKIRRPSIIDFHYNETHRQILGGSLSPSHRYDSSDQYRPRFVPIKVDSDSQSSQSSSQPPTGNNFAPYCLLTFYADFGHRIYAEGFATGLINGGKDWFTETLHFRSNPDSEYSSAGAGTFSIATQKDSLTLVFEQLHQRSTFNFHLILTPFRHSADGLEPYESRECDKSREYRCSNQRCIAKYLICDHHNNCGDYSDEADHCLSKVPTGPPPTSPNGPRPTQPTDDFRSRYPPIDSNGYPGEPSIPTFDINGNRIESPTRYEPNGDGDTIPEYVDVPLPPLIDGGAPVTIGYPGRGDGSGGGGYHGYYPPGYPDSINGKTAGIGENGGGFLKDLFAFSEETSSVVHVVRYLLGVLVIIILVTLINFMIWCLITKRDQSFMAPSGHSQSQAPVATISHA